MTSSVKNYYDNMIISETEDRLLYYLAMTGFDCHFCFRNVWIGQGLMADQILLGHHGLWLLSPKFTGGTIYNVNGRLFKRPQALTPEEIYSWQPIPVASLEEEWLIQKEAVEELLNGWVPGLLDEEPNLVKGGVCLARHDYGSKTVFPALRGNDDIDECEIFFPLDTDGNIVETIISYDEIGEIAQALVDHSLSINPEHSPMIEFFLSQDDRENDDDRDSDADDLIEMERGLWDMFKDYYDNDDEDE